MYGVRKCSSFILLQVVDQFSQHHLLKRLTFLHCIFLPRFFNGIYAMVDWFALEMNRDHSVVFEIASKYCISDSFIDHDGYSILRDSCP